MISRPDTTHVPLLITSAIRPSAPYVELRDVQARLDATLVALERWRVLAPNLSIVFCDGSDFDLASCGSPYLSILRDVEIIKFANDSVETFRRGKGFGEGEIIAHALDKSRVLGSANGFFKCTGKLWVENFPQLLSSIRAPLQIDRYFSRGSLLSADRCDTRFYYVDKRLYYERLRDCHKAVDDHAGIYLEHCFSRALAGPIMSSAVFAVLPQIRGVSGSTAETFSAVEEGRPAQRLRAIRRFIFGGTRYLL